MLTETARSMTMKHHMEEIKNKITLGYSEILGFGAKDEETFIRTLGEYIQHDLLAMARYTDAFKGIHIELQDGKVPTIPAVTVSIDKDNCLGIEIRQWQEPKAEDQQLYAWAGNVFDYLDMYKEDVVKALGVDDIRLYPKGIRWAVGMCYASAEKYEDKQRASNFRSYVMHQVLSHLEELAGKVKIGEQLFAGIEKTTEDLSTLSKQWRNHKAPSGYVEPIFPEYHRPDAFEVALKKQRDDIKIKAALNKDPDYLG